MRTVGILLIIGAAIGYMMSTVAFGDIGISFAFSATLALLAGIGFFIAAKPVNAWKAIASAEATARFKKQYEDPQEPTA